MSAGNPSFSNPAVIDRRYKVTFSHSLFSPAREKGIDAETLRRMVAKVEEYSESHRSMGLPDDLLNILKDDLERSAALRN